MLLSIYLLLSALVSMIVGLVDVFNLYDILDASLTLYGIASILTGICFMVIKETPRNYGFIALIIYLLLDGINHELFVFINEYPKYTFALIGLVALSSGMFFALQRQTWKNIVLIMLSGYLISISFAYFDINGFYIISAIFALPAAVFFFLRKEQSQPL